MRSWFWLVAAAATEVGWVSGVARADSAVGALATLACLIASLGLALAAARRMAATTVYVLFVGLGMSGTVAVDALLFGAPLHASTLGFLALLLAGIVGLKRTSERA